MHITIEHHAGQYPSFNVNLHSKPGMDSFLSIKGCRIVSGGNGPFVSYPSRKNEQTGKYWNHVWANEGFNAEILRLAQTSAPPAPPPRPAPAPSRAPVSSGFEDDFGNGDIPFITCSPYYDMTTSKQRRVNRGRF